MNGCIIFSTCFLTIQLRWGVGDKKICFHFVLSLSQFSISQSSSRKSKLLEWSRKMKRDIIYGNLLQKLNPSQLWKLVKLSLYIRQLSLHLMLELKVHGARNQKGKMEELHDKLVTRSISHSSWAQPETQVSSHLMVWMSFRSQSPSLKS